MSIFLAPQPVVWFVLLFFLGFSSVVAANSNAEAPPPVSGEPSSGRGEVMSAFNGAAETKDVARSTTDEKFRHQLLFFMGLMLLIFVFSTAYFGISMALFGKDVFIPHMISAGVTVFLATAHAVVAVVWFFPF